METRTKVLALVAAVILGGLLIAAGRLPNLNGTYMAGHDGTNMEIVRVDSNGNLSVGGPAVDDAAASGNPAPVGGIYRSTKPTYTDLDRTQLQMGSRGSLHVTLAQPDGTSLAQVSALGDATTNGNNVLYVFSHMANFNGTTWDREFTCPTTATFSIATGVTTQIVALASSQVIRVCSFSITNTLAGSAAFVYGTGSNCATGQTAITGALRIATDGNISMSAGNGSVFRTAASNALCLTAATGTITGFVTYAQY